MLPDGTLQRGAEVVIEGDIIRSIQPWSSTDRNERGAILSPAFVNAHSHLEYYDLKGKLEGLAYWDWIRELTRIKDTRHRDDVQRAAIRAALQNRATGVGAIGETSDWPVSGEAIRQAELQGRIFQEIITVREWDSPSKRIQTRSEWAKQQAEVSTLPVHLSPHATHTVSPSVLRQLASSGEPQSIHVAESRFENEAFQNGSGPIADLLASVDKDFRPTGTTALGYLGELGCLHPRTQIVHACSFSEEDVLLAGATGVTIAHCPRSNINLGCEIAPIAKLRKQGVKVGIGTDSAASSGEIDMFAEMRAARELSIERGQPLSFEDLWCMATREGAESLWLPRKWKIEIGANPRLMLVHGVETLEDAITSSPRVQLLQ
ncbi:MAG: amidohydrolase family protein [Fimbriimonadales bacterium]|nr:amidohydrolase family protein [Fimbriimonadales bacterium]